MTGRLSATEAAPMTLSEGEAIESQAMYFVLRYVRPILGCTHTTKIRNLYCHVMDAVRLHGGLSSCSTASNETAQEDDTRSFVRTSQISATFTHKIVRHSLGAHFLRSRTSTASELLAAEASCSGEDSSRDAGGVSDYGSLHATPQFRLPRVHVTDLRQRQGLSDVGLLLGLSSPGAEVSMATHPFFFGELDSGRKISQLVRALPDYRIAAWNDPVLYRVDVARAGVTL